MMTNTVHPFRSAEAKAEYLAYYDAAAKMWPIPSEEKLVETAYGQTFVRMSGPTAAPPLVLLPGAGSCSLMWRLIIEALSRDHRTYAVDSLIHTGCVGRSIYTRPISTAEEAVAWLDEVVDGLNLGSGINLLGASYGGWLASQYGLHAPERLSKIVLVAPAGTVLPFRGSYILRTILLNMFPWRSSYRRFFERSLPDLAHQDRQVLAAIAAEFALSTRCFKPVNPKQLPVLTALTDDELQSLDVPTLFLVGENEVLYSAQQAVQRIETVAPQIDAAVIPQAGHDLLLVQEKLVTQKILAFLAQSEGTEAKEHVARISEYR